MSRYVRIPKPKSRLISPKYYATFHLSCSHIAGKPLRLGFSKLRKGCTLSGNVSTSQSTCLVQRINAKVPIQISNSTLQHPSI